jgi:RNA polymerase sigma-70 factor (sigma-E family)
MRFEDFAAARLPELLRFATVLTGDPEQGRDLVQESLTRALVNWRRVEAATSPYAYVRAIVTHEFMSDRRRKRHPQVPLTYEGLAIPSAGGDLAARSAQRIDLWQAIMTLPPAQRAVIVLRYYEDLPDEEIAATLKLRPGTVRSYAHRALATLRVDLTDLATNGKGVSA